MAADTEFACEVVRITEIKPHPGADRLELAHFEMKDTGPAAYTVVVRKGEYKVGDLAVYCSVDCVVPLVGPESERWAFLKERLDAKDKPVYRIKAARLRGVYSEGILANNVHAADCCPSHAYQFGAEVAAEWRISYYSPGPKSGPTAPGTATGKKTERKRLAQVKAMVPEYSVVSLRKAPFLFETGEPVVVTEKIHGTNFRFGWIPAGRGYEWFLGSHRTVRTAHETFLERIANKLKFWKRHKQSLGYYGEDLWSAFAAGESLAARSRNYAGIVFYGEIYGMTESGKEIQKGFSAPVSGSVCLTRTTCERRNGFAGQNCASWPRTWSWTWFRLSTPGRS
jgi:RNA ligase (TIGR02306 family)